MHTPAPFDPIAPPPHRALQPVARNAAMPARQLVWPTIASLATMVLCLQAGQWQWTKAERLEATQALLAQRAALPPLTWEESLKAIPASLQFRRITVRGHYVASGQILIDNQVRHGHAGVSVLTPLQPDAGGPRVLIDRGWIATPLQHDVPVTPAVPEGLQMLVGEIRVPSSHAFRLAPDTAPAGNNARWQGIDLSRYAAASGAPIQPFVIRLPPDAAGGFLREWPQPAERQARHRGYALQWWGFAATAAGLWFAWLLHRLSKKAPS